VVLTYVMLYAFKLNFLVVYLQPLFISTLWRNLRALKDELSIWKIKILYNDSRCYFFV